MEVLTIRESEHYQDNMRTAIIMMFKGIGLCGVDTMLVDDGDDEVLSPKEAVSFLKVQVSSLVMVATMVRTFLSLFWNATCRATSDWLYYYDHICTPCP